MALGGMSACSSGAAGRGDAGDGDGIDDAPTDGPSTEGEDTTGTDSGGDVNVVSITIEPADVVIEVLNGQVPAGTNFTAIGLTDLGESIDLSGGTWSYDRPELATLANGGQLSATGDLGGQGILSYEYNGLTAQTTASVKLIYTVDPSIPPEVKDLFPQATTPDPTLALLYPYDQTVLPKGIAGPVLQWNGGNATDLYKVTVDSQWFSLTYYGDVPAPSRWSFPEPPLFVDDTWQKLEDSTVGDVAVTLQRYDGVQAYLPFAQTWKIANADLAGIIYYWEVNAGSVVKLQPGADAPESFLAPPPPVDVGDGNPNNQCIACHSVSADGSTIVASTYGSASPWATWNADGSKIFVSGDVDGVYYPGDSSGFQALSPDGTWILSGQSKEQTALKLSAINSTTELGQLAAPAGYPVFPTWSTDGAKVVYAARADGNWLDFNNSSLWVADFDPNVPGFVNHAQIVAGEPPYRTAVVYPTVSPDSKWVAYNKANQARARGGQGELYYTSIDGQTQLTLTQANGGSHLAPELQGTDFEPTFMPVSLGGYFWMIFVSERPYGNTLTDTAPETRIKQLWVTAIDAVPSASDPSHPAFWLPGQSLSSNNMRGYWALVPCKGEGDGCEGGFDCCSGYCSTDGLCTMDDPECSADGNACETDGDCCQGQCFGGYCGLPTP